MRQRPPCETHTGGCRTTKTEILLKTCPEQLPLRLQSTWDSRMQLVRLQSYEEASSAQTGPNNAVSRASAGPEDPAAEPTRSRSYGGVEKVKPRGQKTPLWPAGAGTGGWRGR